MGNKTLMEFGLWLCHGPNSIWFFSKGRLLCILVLACAGECYPPAASLLPAHKIFNIAIKNLIKGLFAQATHSGP